MEEWILYMGIGTVILLVIGISIILGLYLSGYYKKTRSSGKKKIKSIEPKEPIIENYEIGPAIWLHNHLKKPLEAIYYPPDGKSNIILYPLISPETVVGIPKEELEKQGVVKGGKIQFRLKEDEMIQYTAGNTTEGSQIYNDYLLEDITLPKNIYIGLTTTKTLHFTSPVIFGGVYEMTFINIHNRLSIPLTFNGHIHVPANGRVIYNGYNLDGGVAVGEILSNDEGFFNPFEIEIPVSDVYFGVVSDQDLPVYQGNKYLWQGKL